MSDPRIIHWSLFKRRRITSNYLWKGVSLSFFLSLPSLTFLFLPSPSRLYHSSILIHWLSHWPTMAIPSNPSLSAKYMQLNSGTGIQVEYLWIDSDNDIRSRARTLAATEVSLETLPEWWCQGSATGQGEDLVLHPVALFDDPFRPPHGKLVLCDTYLPDGTPHPTNYRYHCQRTMSTYATHRPLFGIEQEYMVIDPELEKPLGWHRFPDPQVSQHTMFLASPDWREWHSITVV